MRRTAVVLGAGSYVLGDSFGDGVVLPTLLQEVRDGGLDRIQLLVRSHRDEGFHARLADLQRRLGCAVPVEERLVAGPADLARLDLADAVAFVSTPDATHAGYVEALLHAGVPTWIVKPLADSGTRSERLAQLARSLRVPLYVDYHKRFDPSFRKLETLVRGGTLGPPVFLGVQFTQPARLPLGDLAAWARDVDVFQYIGCHFVDLALWLLPGARAERVSATGLPGRLAQLGGPAFDLVHASLDLLREGGARTRVDLAVGWSDPEGAPAKSHQRVEVVFEHGRAIVDQKERGFETWTPEGFGQLNPHFLQLLPDPSRGRVEAHGYGPESLRRFLGAYRHAESSACERLPWAAQAVRVDRVVDAVRASLAQDGDWVGVREPAGSVPAPEKALQWEL